MSFVSLPVPGILLPLLMASPWAAAQGATDELDLRVSPRAAAQGATDELDLCRSCHGGRGLLQVREAPVIAGRSASDPSIELQFLLARQRHDPRIAMAERLVDEEVEELVADSQ